jgi:hypothetical protein
MLSWIRRAFKAEKKTPETTTEKDSREWNQIPEKKDSRDWIEDFSKPDGRFIHKCVFCKESFIGHKLRVACKICCLSISI